MAVETGLAFVDVTAYALVFVVHITLVMFVTNNTLKGGEDPTDVAIGTVIPFVSVFAGIDGEITAVVIPGCLIPIDDVVAQGTIGGESGVDVVGFRVVVVKLMTGNTIGGCAGVAVLVASQAVKGCVCAGQGEGGLIVIEGGGLPGNGAMALGTVGREVVGHVVGVGDTVVVAFVTGDTVAGCTGITVFVTGDTV